VKQTWLLASLLACYAVAGFGIPGRQAGSRFDPLAPRPHSIERLVVARRFAEALPLVTELRGSHPREPLVVLWLAIVQHGLGHWQAEAHAWEDFLRLSPDSLEGCPSLPEAYERAGDLALSLSSYERCVQLDQNDAVRHLDLGSAYERVGRSADALASFRRAAELDPENPALRAHLAKPAGLSVAVSSAASVARQLNK
jgi:tetratricopeptide (TPR) repeat protein